MAINSNFNSYMTAKSFSPNSVRAYTHNIEQCLEFIGKPENEITSMDMIDWKISISKYSTSTISQKITSVRTYFRFLYRHHIIKDDPTIELESPEVVNEEKHHMTAQQVSDMMNACKNIEDKAIICLFASSGMRVSELTGLTVKEYKTMRANGSNRIYIVSKNKKLEPVIINNQCINLIDQYLEVRSDCGTGEEYLFLSPKGNHIAGNKLSAKLKVIAKDAGIPWWNKMCNHQLRAACATINSDRGVPIAQIRDIMRHSSTDMTNRYIKRSEDVIEANVMNVCF